MPHVLLVPGALMPQHEREHFAPDRVPARLARRLQRATWTQRRFTAPWSDGAAHLAWLADAFAVAGDPPAVAPFALRASSPAGSGSAAEVWFCDPVHLSLEPERTVLSPIEAPALSEEEAAELFDEAADAARALGAELRRAGAHWYLLTDPPWSLDTTALQAALGASVEHRLPQGQHAARWRRLLNEVQMRWHTSRTNRARDAQGQQAANGLWLHGGGSWRPLAASRFGQVHSDDPAVLGWQQAAGSGAGSVAASDALTIWPDLFDPYWRRNWGAWGAGWTALDATLEALLRAARSGSDGRVALVACGRRSAVSFMLSSGAGLLEWRRRALNECLLEPDS
jgi:hypothetical protein